MRLTTFQYLCLTLLLEILACCIAILFETQASRANNGELIARAEALYAKVATRLQHIDIQDDWTR